MVRHTLKSLGPKVLADPDGPRLRRRSSTRPAARHARARSTPTTPAPRELAAWKQRVRAGWPAVRVEHVESQRRRRRPRGRRRRSSVRAFVALGDLVARRRRRAGRARPGRQRRRRSSTPPSTSLDAGRDLRGRPAPLRRRRRARPRRPVRLHRAGAARATSTSPPAAELGLVALPHDVDAAPSV